MFEWPFDQEKNTAALTTRQVLRYRFPILSVVHYSDDHSWGFTCGTTNEVGDCLVVDMACIVDLDPTVESIADLPPGWCAEREFVGAAWERWQDDDY